MSTSIFNGVLRKVDLPLAWESVRVLDPRQPDRTTKIMLLTREVRVRDLGQAPDLAGNLPVKADKVLVTPLIPNVDGHTVWEIVDFQVVDPRFSSMTVQVGLLPQEARAYRRSIELVTGPAGQLETTNTGKEYRYKCGFPSCDTTSSQISDIKTHFNTNHDGFVFQLNKVRTYEVGSRADPNVIDKILAPASTQLAKAHEPGAHPTRGSSDKSGVGLQIPQLNHPNAVITSRREHVFAKDDMFRYLRKYGLHTPVAPIWHGEVIVGFVVEEDNQANITPNNIANIGLNNPSVTFSTFASSTVGLKHRRDTNDTDTASANKRIRLRDDFPVPDIPGPLYLDRPKGKESIDGQERICFCPQAHGGKRTVECCVAGCSIQYYHVDCVQKLEKNPITEGLWICAYCVGKYLKSMIRMKSAWMDSMPNRGEGGSFTGRITGDGFRY